MRKPLLTLATTLLLGAPIAVAQNAGNVLDDPLLDRLADEYEPGSEEPFTEPDRLPAEDASGMDIGGEFELRTGYDSNFDREVIATGSPFAEYEISGEAIWRSGRTAVFASGETVVTSLPALEESARAEVNADVGIRTWVTENAAVEAAIEADFDAADDPVTVETTGALSLRVMEKLAAFGVRMSYNRERALFPLLPGDLFEPIEEDVDTGLVEAGLLLLPQNTVSPLVLVSASRSTSPFSDPGAGIFLDDANTYSVLAGLRLQPSSDLTLTSGIRLSRRVADDPLVGELTVAEPEFSLDWRFADDWRTEAFLETTLDAPGEPGSRGEQATLASASIRYDPDLGLGWRLGASHLLEREIGEGSFVTTTTLDLRVEYRFTENLVLESGIWRKIYADDGDIIITDQFVISGGFDASF